MRWATYLSPRDGQDHIGVVLDGVLHGSRKAKQLISLLADDAELARAADAAITDPLETVPEKDLVLRAPVPVPPSIRDFMAFEEHVVTSMRAIGRDVDPVWYKIPVFYFTNPAAVRGPKDAVPIAPGSRAFDYEMEIGAIIGRPGSDIPSAARGARGTATSPPCGVSHTAACTSPRSAWAWRSGCWKRPCHTPGNAGSLVGRSRSSSSSKG
jgi:hypothetical protein